MANTNITIRIDNEDKDKAISLFSDFGLTLNAAINMFIKQSIREQRIPFELSRNTKEDK